MAYASSAHFELSATAPRCAARELLFKDDHPRAIDRYIDYFGGAGATQADTDEDPCGEAFLERPA